MATILALIFNETLKVTTSLTNEFSIENHVKMRYSIKIYIGQFRKYKSNMAPGGHFEYYKRKDIPLRGNWDFLQVI